MAAKPWIIKPLVLPLGDKKYTVQPVEYHVGLSLLAVGTPKAAITEESDESELFALVMGDTWAEMLADKRPGVALFRAGAASLEYQIALLSGVDSDAAVQIGEKVWESGLSPEAVAAALAAYQKQTEQAAKKTSTPSSSSGSAGKTPPRASTRTTTSRQTTPRTKTPTKGQPRRGTQSPRSGR